jgi:hypothetical protein
MARAVAVAIIEPVLTIFADAVPALAADWRTACAEACAAADVPPVPFAVAVAIALTVPLLWRETVDRAPPAPVWLACCETPVARALALALLLVGLTATATACALIVPLLTRELIALTPVREYR